MSHRELSPAEEEGWRRFWDGWIICPPCIEEHLSSHRETFKNTQTEWPVPANYDTPIGEADREYDSSCMKCGKLPPLLLTWKTQLAA